MASSFNDDQSSTEENFGPIALNELQKVFNDEPKSAESAELTNSPTTNDTTLDNIVLLGDTDNINKTIINNNQVSFQPQTTINTYVKNFGLATQRLLSTCDDNNIIADSSTPPVSPLVPSTGKGQLVVQDFSTTIDNLQTQLATERHIMISYNRASSFDICRKICQRLRNRGYNVWMDDDNLHGSVFKAMAQGIQNAYIVLLCYNERYSKSDYCKQEATYAFEKRIGFIPCRLQESYQPDDWLGILISDRLYIDFSSPDDFDNSFKKLVDEIEYINTQSQTHPNRTAILRSDGNDQNVQMNNQIMREQFNTIIREYKESINKNDHDLHLLEKEELCELIIRLRERLFNDTLLTSHNEQGNLNNDKILHDLFKQSHTQTELLKKITEILSKPMDFRTIIRLSLAFMFVWTVKTHIIDAYLKHK